MTEEMFTQCVRRNSRRLYLIAFSYMGKRDDAEDAVQNVFVKLWNSKTEFDDDVHMDKWLTRVCVNECKRTLKYMLRHKNAPLEEAETYPVFDKESYFEVYQAVQSLKRNDRLAIHLFYFEQLSVKEIAALMNQSENAVKTRLHRARQALKTILGEEWTSE